MSLARGFTMYFRSAAPAAIQLTKNRIATTMGSFIGFLLTNESKIRLAASRGLVFASPEILDEMFGGAQRERQNADGCGLVGAIQKHAGVADIQVRHIVGLS